MKLKDFITDKKNLPDIITNNEMKFIKKTHNSYITGKNYTNYGLLEEMPKGKCFYVLKDMKQSNESGDFTWCFSIAIRYYNKWYCLTDQG